MRQYCRGIHAVQCASLIASHRGLLLTTHLVPSFIESSMSPGVTALLVWKTGTPGDFGRLGEKPTHPELLDWLAVEFMESGWDVKHMMRLMVQSQAYKRDSRATPEMLAQDPLNRQLARGPRFRLPAWMLRDAALHHAGLLNPALGGPPVRPYQPEGVWEELFMGRFKYEPSEGPAQYRRTLYAFWRRTIAPTFLFDSAQRRSCEIRTARTNTPLQALTLLNDQTFLEAAKVLAAKPVEAIFNQVLSRQPDEQERDGHADGVRHEQQHRARPGLGRGNAEDRGDDRAEAGRPPERERCARDRRGERAELTGPHVEPRLAVEARRHEHLRPGEHPGLRGQRPGVQAARDAERGLRQGVRRRGPPRSSGRWPGWWWGRRRPLSHRQAASSGLLENSQSWPTSPDDRHPPRLRSHW